MTVNESVTLDWITEFHNYRTSPVLLVFCQFYGGLGDLTTGMGVGAAGDRSRARIRVLGSKAGLAIGGTSSDCANYAMAMTTEMDYG